MDKNKILKMTVILAGIVVIAGSVSRLIRRDSMSLSDYASLHSSPAAESDTDRRSKDPSSQTDAAGDAGRSSEGSSPQTDAAGDAGRHSEDSATQPTAEPSPSPAPAVSHQPATEEPVTPSASPDPAENAEDISPLVGASLNGTSQLEERYSLEDGFYYEPLSEHLQRYITGISFPSAGEEGTEEPEITFSELRYVHILHYDFDGNSAEGELICNEYIAQDLVEIFCELYHSEYRLEKVRLIDEYDGDDTASMEDNNTSCFNYRPVSGTSRLSKHAFGLAIDINPFYNPYVAYDSAGNRKVSPADASPYADRTLSFPYKIDEDDLCYKLFMEHGFIWGGNWNSMKDYQHFQKTK